MLQCQRTVVLSTLTLLSLAFVSPARAHVPQGCAPHPSGCPQRGACITVPSDLTLNPTCDYHDVVFRFTTSGTSEDPIEFDCDDARIHGDRGINSGLDLHSHDGGDPLQHVTVRNCNVDGYKFTIAVYLLLSGTSKAAIRSEYDEFFHEPIRRDRFVEGIDDNLRTHAPQNIRFENVHVSGASDVGFYLFSHVHHVTFAGGSSRGTHIGPGIYLDTATRHNTIERSEIYDNEREGIALDSSAMNRIQFNNIHDNDGGGIFLYKNFWEKKPEGQIPRSQHSRSNEIVSNTIRESGVGIWIASRQSDARTPGKSPRYDPLYYVVDTTNPFGGTIKKYYRERAEDNLILGNTIRASTGIRVYDDGTQIIGNRFEGFFGSTAISVGNNIRKAVGEPVTGTMIRDNRFANFVRPPVSLVHCAEFTRGIRNWTQIGSLPSRSYSLPAVSCNEQHATLWRHSAGGGGFEYLSSLNRSGVFRSGQRWVTGDFNGDGKDDVARIYGTSDGRARVFLQLATGSGFETKSSFQTMASFIGSGHWLASDFNGDGLDDLIHVYRGANNQATAWVHQSTSEEFAFQSAFTRLTTFSAADKWLSGDVDGDGKDDLVRIYPDASDRAHAWVHRALNGRHEYRTSVSRLAGYWPSQKWRMGDFDRDGRDDLVNIYRSAGTGLATAWSHRSLGSGFEYQTSFDRFAGFWPEQQWVVADFNNDQRDDLVNVYGANGTARAWRHASAGTGFQYQTGLQSLAGFSNAQRWLGGDFNDDGFSDLLNVYGSSSW